MSKSYYDILELDKKCSYNDIKKSYKRLALKYHPDRNKELENSHKFNEINEAYNTLIDPSKRNLYDITFNLNNNSFNFYDIFKEFQNGEGGVDKLFGYNTVELIKKTGDFINIIKKSINTYKDFNHKFKEKKKKNDEFYKKEEEEIKNHLKDIDKILEENGELVNDNKDIHHKIEIKLNDIYNNKIKRTTVSVLRYNNETNNYDLIKNKLLIEPSEKINIFENEADDYEFGEKRGNIIIEIIPLEYNNITYIGNNNLFIEKDISLYELLYGVNFKIKYLDDKFYNYCIYERIELDKTYEINNMGLLNFENQIKGKLYVKFNLKIEQDDAKMNLIKELFPILNNNTEYIGEYLRI
jgi:molecular chaperone DnaJ